MVESDEEVRRGAAVYSKRVLGIYDVLVVYLSNTFVWRCHRRRITELYERYAGARHLDVGPGTGWYLANARMPSGRTVTLLDLNSNSLASARARLAVCWSAAMALSIHTAHKNASCPAPGP